MDKVMHPKQMSKRSGVAKSPDSGKIKSYTPSMKNIQAFNHNDSKKK